MNPIDFAPLRIAFLASGNGGNLKFLRVAQHSGLVAGPELSVIADRPCASLDYAREQGLRHREIRYSRQSPDALRAALRSLDPDVIVTTWNKIIDRGTVDEFAGKMVNLHYSLLPAFAGTCGTEALRRAYEQGCRYAGVTCHRVDENVDTGEILCQSVFDTDREFADAVRLMFRQGCLTLLNGLQILTQRRPADAGAGDGMHSPPLGFDAGRFTPGFWASVEAA